MDGRCGVCARCADFLVRLDRAQRLEIVPSQAPGVLARFGLTPDEVAASIWFVPGGAGSSSSSIDATHAISGARAAAAALDTVLGTRALGFLASLPGLGWALERGYRWVAKNRRRLPGALPWCERDWACEG